MGMETVKDMNKAIEVRRTELLGQIKDAEGSLSMLKAKLDEIELLLSVSKGSGFRGAFNRARTTPHRTVVHGTLITPRRTVVAPHGATMTSRILNMIRNEPAGLSMREIATRVGADGELRKRQLVSSVLYRFRKDGLVYKDKDGKHHMRKEGGQG